MKKHFLIAWIALLSISCNAQDQTPKATTENSPKGTWKVDKEFDEQGNLIKYDSIYSWSSHNSHTNLTAKDADSIMQAFKSKFFANHSGISPEYLDNMFAQDSIFNFSFFKDDLFADPFKDDFVNMEELRKQMIARHQSFLQQQQPALIKPEADE
ncbi:hypothetical protein FNB79_16075 [Formosa sediminum]|uniref:Uncharacterized protein n=1 Tax=Formosa sediminum TaxID=2594004 RepID=A0A516GV65_9FLAO|nr:hypothetical protein [Formosa sediminum]QDO95421.1 hypothetical protein FNB79_16075 [Formosa sediminum]